MKRDILNLRLGAAVAAFVAVAACGNPSGQAQNQAQPQPQPEASAMIKTPESISHEHHEIHEVLAAAAKEPGPVGDAARRLEALLAPHFQREEEIGTPPLGLLRPLATGQASADMRAVLPMTDALEAELPKMLKEHEAIGAANAALREAAAEAGRDDLVGFAETLAAHARQEEEILYPAAIMVGRHVKATAPEK
jgi:hypothetical protein